METDDENLIDMAVRTLARERSAELNEGCQKQRLIDDIEGAVIRWTVASKLTPHDAAFWFGHAMDWLDELQVAANPLCRSYGEQENEKLRKSLEGAGQSLKEPLGVIWIRRDLVRAVTNEKSPDALWRVDMDGVSECAGEYLRQPWANVPSVERLMVEMLTFSEALAFAQAAKIEVAGLFGPISPFVRWPWIVFKSLVRVAAILYVAYGAAEMFGLWAGLLGATAMYYLLRTRMVKKFKPLETARVSRRDRGAYLALWGWQ
jgi:hypothetical protein